jgi:hypothetical protein
METVLDYSDAGLTIQRAMVDHARRYPDKHTRPDHILWNSRKVKTSDCFAVAREGKIKLEILHSKPNSEQGVDLKVDNGFELADGARVPLLRTWKDERFEDIVEYNFLSRDGRIFVWNVYKMHYGNGQVIEEKWTNNAGFWIEHISESERIYHCSSGVEKSPVFDSFVFKVKVSSAVEKQDQHCIPSL